MLMDNSRNNDQDRGQAIDQMLSRISEIPGADTASTLNDLSEKADNIHRKIAMIGRSPGRYSASTN